MPNDFTGNQPDAELARKINACDNYEKLRMVLKDSLVEKGVLARTVDGNYVPQENIVVAPPQPAPSAAAATHFRWVYPHGNDRFEIFGSSEQELNEKEAAIRALYQRQ